MLNILFVGIVYCSGKNVELNFIHNQLRESCLTYSMVLAKCVIVGVILGQIHHRSTHYFILLSTRIADFYKNEQGSPTWDNSPTNDLHAEDTGWFVSKWWGAGRRRIVIYTASRESEIKTEVTFCSNFARMNPQIIATGGIPSLEMSKS